MFKSVTSLKFRGSPCHKAWMSLTNRTQKLLQKSIIAQCTSYLIIISSSNTIIVVDIIIIWVRLHIYRS